MHQPTLASGSLRGVAHTTSAASIIFCLHGMFVRYELFSVIVAGFDLLNAVYLFGIVLAVTTTLALIFKMPRVEYACMSMSIWIYALLLMFSALVTSLHSPAIVICFILTMLNVVLATHIKKGEIDEPEKDLGSDTKTEDQLQSGIPSGDQGS